MTTEPSSSLNDFAKRCFRDTADQDYIAARLAFRARLYPQFMWLGLQALEKYLKGILLFNRASAKDLGHGLGRAIKRVNGNCPFTLRLTEPTITLLEYLDTYGRFRYLETAWHCKGDELHLLDLAVWEIRRYCQALNVDVVTMADKKRNLLKLNLAGIEAAEKKPPQAFRLSNGYLEQILAIKAHPAREALAWKNLRYGIARRRKVKFNVYMQAVNSPLSLHPEILDEVEKYVFLPKDVRLAFREESRKRAKQVNRG